MTAVVRLDFANGSCSVPRMLFMLLAIKIMVLFIMTRLISCPFIVLQEERLLAENTFRLPRALEPRVQALGMKFVRTRWTTE